MTNSFRIVAKGLEYGYGRGHDSVLRDISLSVDPGQILCVLGVNGSGKTTLLSAAAGLTTPTSGTIGFERVGDGTSLMPRIAFLHQDYRQTNLPWASVLENVTYPLTFRRVASAERRERGSRILAELLPEIGLSRPIHSLSGGQQQLVAIARALVCEPHVMLADEPLSAADAVHRVRAAHSVSNRCKALNAAIMWVSHDIDEALLLGDQIALLSRRTCGFARVIQNPAPRPRGTMTLSRSDIVELKRALLEALISDASAHGK